MGGEAYPDAHCVAFFDPSVDNVVIRSGENIGQVEHFLVWYTIGDWEKVAEDLKYELKSDA